MSRLSLRLGVALAVAGIVVTVLTVDGHAVSQGSLTVTRQQHRQTKSYNPIAASNPSLTHRPADCQTAPYCDVIDLNVDTRAFKSDDAYQLYFTLTWFNAEQNSDALEIHVYDKTNTKVASSTTGVTPEHTSVDLPYNGIYHVVINNFAGANTGYTFTVDLEYLGKLKAIPKLEEPTDQGPRFTPLPPLPSKAQPNLPSTPPPQSLTPNATLAPVLTPGPDGKTASYALDAISIRGKSEKGGMSWWVLLIVVAALVGLVGSGGYYFFRRLRARAT